MELKGKKILLTGGSGFLGKFVQKELMASGVREEDIRIPNHLDNDLRVWKNCEEAVLGMDLVVHLAASVGGIGFNQRNPGVLFYDNMIMGAHLMEAARKRGVEKFIQIGTVCAYPKFTPVPFKEDNLWDGYPEETNAPYGVAKKALLVQAQAYRQQYGLNAIYLLPVNLYGPGDNFHLEDSHVIPALIRKCVEAVDSGSDTITVWGTGEPTREFLYVEDCARGIVLAARDYDDPEPVNLGSGEEISIRDLITLIARITGFDGNILWDATRPDGQPRRCLDTERAGKFGFKAEVSFEDGIARTVQWYIEKGEGAL
ncbi:MAG: GDP-L-fucose synthase [bacterium]|nr:GDP-L-fucose synthase [bacterium]MDT8366582.1 GDP-L-fucose synthase [bacterium]